MISSGHDYFPDSFISGANVTFETGLSYTSNLSIAVFGLIERRDQVIVPVSISCGSIVPVIIICGISALIKVELRTEYWSLRGKLVVKYEVSTAIHLNSILSNAIIKA